MTVTRVTAPWPGRCGNPPRSRPPASPVDRKTHLNSSHRDLPSSPTRRSSDLHQADVARPNDGDAGHGTLARTLRESTTIEAARFTSRSEDTSELQSPRSPLFPYTTLFRSPPGRRSPTQ